ncbi:type VI secretion system ATPase TssH, partial [Vibrio alginolyticus]
FKNTIIIMTANTGTETTMSLYSDPDLSPEPSALKDALRDDLLVDFKPAFLGRVNVLPYLPLSRKLLIEITKLKLDKITTRIRKHYNADLFFDEELINDIVDNSNESGSGARVVQTTIENTLLPKISHEILHAILNDKTFDEIIVKGTTSGLDVSIV